MPNQVLSRFSRATTIGHSDGIKISISKQLVECHNMDATWDDIAEGVCSAVSRCND